MRLLWQWGLLAGSLVVLSVTVLGLAFAGSPERLPAGARIAGIDVAGLTPGRARSMLEKRERGLGSVPVTFTADGHSWQVKPISVIVRTNWKAAVQAARRQGDGFGPVRGLRRLGVRVFGGDVVPTTQVYQAALDEYLGRFARAVDRPRVEPSLRLNGLEPQVVQGHSGRVLDKVAAAQIMVQALNGFSRGPVLLPLRVDPLRLSPQDMAGAVTKARIALSAPVVLSYGSGGWRLTPRRIARLLVLPQNGSTALHIGGRVGVRFFTKLHKRVAHAPKDATFSIGARNVVRVLPAQPGRELDAKATIRSLLTAMLSTSNRRADLRVAAIAPARTTGQAQAMGITGLVGAYETFYGGIPNRIHNVQTVAHLIDNHFIAPGAEFSFNKTTGDRTPAKGFLLAPVIINGELKTALGGGICQVSTTTFNAAYEAGLPITDRTNHALYISHYPLGRDATVNYPDTDLKFVNDTGRWLWLRTFVGSSSLIVALYGTPQNRKIVSDVTPLVVNGSAPDKHVPDPSLFVGQKVLDQAGSPSSSTSVRRRVYSASGKLLYDHTWYSRYTAVPNLIRVGTKPRPAKAPLTNKKNKSKKAPPPPPPPPPPPAGRRLPP